MDYKEIALVLEELRTATNALFPNRDIHASDEAEDMDRIAETLARRGEAVGRISDMISREPEAFSANDLTEIQSAQLRGKRALETMLKVRREKFSLVSQMTQNQYILRTISSPE